MRSPWGRYDRTMADATDLPPPRDRGLRGRVLAGEALLGTLLTSGSAMFAEICARAGFDWVMADLEHGAGTEADLLGQLQGIQGGGAAGLVRVQQASRIAIGRALDLGAEGVMVPRLESLEEARQVVSWLRYPPTGERGVALFTRGARLGTVAHESIGELSERVLGIVQVENRTALGAAEEIAALDGVDVLFVGPTDLSHALGVPGRLDEQPYRDAVTTVGRAAKRHGKAAGVLVWAPEDLERYADEGFRFFAISSDGGILNRAARAAVDGSRKLLGRYA